MQKTQISVVVPVYNEVKNIPELLARLKKALDSTVLSYEIITVDDGSRDGSGDELMKQASTDSHIHVIRFGGSFGETAALAAGIERARGDTIVTSDSDLENDPADIVRLLQKIDEGYDVGSGWREGRWAGSWLTRKLPSITANKI